MRFGSSLGLFLIAGALPTPLLAQQQYLVTVKPVASSQGYIKTRISKATISQQEIRLWRNYAINPDCSAMTPGTTLAVIEPPVHGTARISDDPLYPDFPRDNVRSACNVKLVAMKTALYQAQAGFAGHDRVVLLGSQPGGIVRRITVDIDVR